MYYCPYFQLGLRLGDGVRLVWIEPNMEPGLADPTSQGVFSVPSCRVISI